MDPHFLIVEGNIGAGKTTLTTQLSQKLGFTPLYEPVDDNPYLKDFYQDIPRWTFPMQVHLLSRRFALHQRAIALVRSGTGVVCDRSIYGDTVFARMHYETGMMDPRDWATYLDLFRSMKQFLCYPDLIIYLETDPEVAYRRIKERGRESEKTGISLDYLCMLHDRYTRFISEIGRWTPVLRMLWHNFLNINDVVGLIEVHCERNSEFIKDVRRV